VWDVLVVQRPALPGIVPEEMDQKLSYPRGFLRDEERPTADRRRCTQITS